MAEPFIGQVLMFAGNFAPRGWALCNGQHLNISSHTALFSILGTTYGGDGRTTFALPDLRGRVPRHAGTGPGLAPVSLGQNGGAASHSMTVQQMPPHSHAQRIPVNESEADSDSPSGSYHAATEESIYASAPDENEFMGSSDTANAGGGASFSLLNPYLGLNYIIALVGTFPSRS